MLLIDFNSSVLHIRSISEKVLRLKLLNDIMLKYVCLKIYIFLLHGRYLYTKLIMVLFSYILDSYYRFSDAQAPFQILCTL